MMRLLSLALSSSGMLLCAACGPSNTPTAESKAETPTATEQAVDETQQELAQATGQNVQITPADLAAGMRADNVVDPKAKFATAAVKSSAGEPIGEVRSVGVGADGKATAVVVEVGGFLNSGERLISIKAARFTYLPDRNILVVSTSKQEIEKMPPAVILN